MHYILFVALVLILLVSIADSLLVINKFRPLNNLFGGDSNFHPITCRKQTSVCASKGMDQSTISVERQVPDDFINSKGIRSWPTWGCGISKFPWTYDSTETCLIIRGEVVVTPDSGEPVKLGAGDYCTFPAGLSCTWDVKAELLKHYNFEWRILHRIRAKRCLSWRTNCR